MADLRLPGSRLCFRSTSRVNLPHSTKASFSRSRTRRLYEFRSSRLLSTSSAIMSATSPERKLVLLPVANGSEEMEVVIAADVLRRAGADVILASVEENLQIVASRNVKLVADTFISACADKRYDLIVLPGGMPGAAHLRDSLVLRKLTQEHAQANRIYAAICAAPVVALQSWGLLNGLKATCHPAFREKLSKLAASDCRVVRDGQLTTSQGPGTGFEFALSLVEQLYGQKKFNEISKPLVLRGDDAVKPSVQEFSNQGWTFKNSVNVLVPIANGSEEMEVVIVVDVLRRAGFDVVLASVEKDLEIVASRNVKITADRLLHEVAAGNFDIVILPGGMPGAERLGGCEALIKLLHKQVETAKCVGAICAAPAVVLEPKGFLKGKKATSHPAFSMKLSDQTAVDTRVVIDGYVLTSRGPGTAMEFALSIVGKFLGHEKAHSIAETMVLPYP